MSNTTYSLCVIGAGSYGTSLAIAVASKGLKVKLWDRNPERAAAMQLKRENARYLLGIKFPDSLDVTSDLEQAIKPTQTILIVVPSHTFRSILEKIKNYITPDHRIAWATKGLDSSGMLLSDVAMQFFSKDTKFAAISGPTFALELAKNLPTAIAVSGNDPKFTKDLSNILHTPTFRIYENSDFIALQLGGAIKNVIAIACGLSDGLGYGANSRTALVTRGLAEMVRFGISRGATERGFMGLSGLGDLILTCTDDQSRNRRLGYMLGKGMSLDDAMQKIGQVVEGVKMTSVVHALSTELKVQMPICSELYEVIYNHKDGKAAAIDLLSRTLKSE